MLIIAVDATSDRLSVAAGRPGGPSVRRLAVGARRHAGLLVPLVNEALAELGAGLDDATALAVADGPGSFTGLRVAAAWAKGVARVRAIPVWTASTLLVRAVGAEAPGCLVLGVHSALRGEWFVAGYRFGEDRSIETALEPMVTAPGGTALRGIRPAAVAGDSAAPLVAAEVEGQPLVLGPPAGLPDAGCLIGLVGRAGGAERIPEIATWEPGYGRPAEAQAKWEREHGRPLSSPSSAAD